MGIPLDIALGQLLPASIAISLLQMRGEPVPEKPFIRQLFLWCLLPMSVALAVVLRFEWKSNLHLFAAGVLAAYAAVRISPPLKIRAETWVAGHTRLWLIVMGVVHGLSNLGGSLLVILAGSRHRNKEEIRRLIAFCYAAFASVQLVVLWVFSPNAFGPHQLLNAAIAILIFLLAGNRTFRWVTALRFEHALTTFIAFYAVMLFLNAFGII